MIDHHKLTLCHPSFSRIHLDHKELLSRHSYMDPSKKYSRNLIATDDERYTLLMVCWNPGKESPIHDHPSDGCWMRVMHGNIQESRYRLPQKGGDKLECFMDETHQGEWILLKKFGTCSKSFKLFLTHLIDDYRGSVYLHYGLHGIPQGWQPFSNSTSHVTSSVLSAVLSMSSLVGPKPRVGIKLLHCLLWFLA